jgi:hypothetical protein
MDWTGQHPGGSGLDCGSLYSSLNRIVAAASTAVVSEMEEPLCHALLCKEGHDGDYYFVEDEDVDLKTVI